jgi:CelD/BcsL family acetyltransferase involved in cellulose biosynthesis
VDGAGDLEWIIEQWERMWAADPEQETVAAPDRLRFWGALAKASPPEGMWKLHTIQLLSGDRRAAGTVLLCKGDTVSFQCTARDFELEKLSAGTRLLEVAIEWAAENGYACFDLGGGGGNKHHWAPPGTTRHRVSFRPALIRRLAKVHPG